MDTQKTVHHHIWPVANNPQCQAVLQLVFGWARETVSQLSVVSETVVGQVHCRQEAASIIINDAVVDSSPSHGHTKQ